MDSLFEFGRSASARANEARNRRHEENIRRANERAFDRLGDDLPGFLIVDGAQWCRFASLAAAIQPCHFRDELERDVEGPNNKTVGRLLATAHHGDVKLMDDEISIIGYDGMHILSTSLAESIERIRHGQDGRIWGGVDSVIPPEPQEEFTSENEPVAPAASGHERPDEAEAEIMRIAQAYGGSELATILGIAKQPSLSADEKMKQIVRIDRSFQGKDSNDWATLLEVTPAAVRQTESWKAIRAQNAS